MSLLRAIIALAMAATAFTVAVSANADANTTTNITTNANATGVETGTSSMHGDYHFLWASAASNQSTCEPSTFSHNASGPNPAANWRSCAALFSSWTNRNGTFLIHDDSGQMMIPILESSSLTGGGGGSGSKGCVLGVRAAAEGHGFYTVGDGDVKAILKTALLKFSDGTDLHVQGDVNCTVISGGRATLHWEIYGEDGFED